MKALTLVVTILLLVSGPGYAQESKEAPDSIATVVKLDVVPTEDWANLRRFKKANVELAAPAADEKRVVFMGDSITEGWKRFDAELFESNPFVNRGISGQTTTQMLVRFRSDVIALRPKAVVIHAGTNDIAANRGEISLEDIAGTIFSMAELAQANGIKVVLASVLPAIDYSWRPGREPADKIIALNKMIQSYAQKHNIVYVDYYSPMVDDQKGLKKELGRDTVHPNLEGYLVMRPLVKKGIAEALKE